MKPGTTGLGSVNSSGLRFRGEEVQTRTCAWENWTSGDVRWLSWNLSVCLSVCIYAACMHVHACVRTYVRIYYIYISLYSIIYCIVFIDLSMSIQIYPCLSISRWIPIPIYVYVCVRVSLATSKWSSSQRQPRTMACRKSDPWIHLGKTYRKKYRKQILIRKVLGNPHGVPLPIPASQSAQAQPAPSAVKSADPAPASTAAPRPRPSPAPPPRPRPPRGRPAPAVVEAPWSERVATSWIPVVTMASWLFQYQVMVIHDVDDLGVPRWLRKAPFLHNERGMAYGLI